MTQATDIPTGILLCRTAMRGVVIDMNAMVVKKVVGKCLDKGKCKAEPARARPNMIASIIEENGLQASGFKDAKHY